MPPPGSGPSTGRCAGDRTGLIFDQPLQLTGGDDLVIEGQVDTNLAGRVVSTQAGLAFDPPEATPARSEASALVSTGARVRDMAGRVTYAELDLKDDRLRLALPGKWLAAAEYP